MIVHRCLSPKCPRPRYPSPVRYPLNLKLGRIPIFPLPVEYPTYLILLSLPTDCPPQTVLFSLLTGQFPNYRNPWPTFRLLKGLRLGKCIRPVTDMLPNEVGSKSDIGGYKRTTSCEPLDRIVGLRFHTAESKFRNKMKVKEVSIEILDCVGEWRSSVCFR